MWISEQDEDGTLAKCKPTGKVKNDCCATYLVGSSEYDHDGDGEKSEKQKYNSITEGKVFLMPTNIGNISYSIFLYNTITYSLLR